MKQVQNIEDHSDTFEILMTFILQHTQFYLFKTWIQFFAFDFQKDYITRK